MFNEFSSLVTVNNVPTFVTENPFLYENEISQDAVGQLFPGNKCRDAIGTLRVLVPPHLGMYYALRVLTIVHQCYRRRLVIRARPVGH